MSLPMTKPPSLSTSPSLGPTAARVAAQDAQIAQLVQQVRTLEHTITQLHAQLEAEKTRGIDAVNQIKEQWQTESKEWRDGCDALQSKHRLAHLSTRIALEHERELRLQDKEALVREKVSRIFHEHKITLYQARETDLVAQVATLEEEIEMYRESMDQAMVQHEADVTRFTAKIAKSDTLRQERAKELGESTQEKEALESELTALRASSASNAKQIERLTLQAETLRTQNAATEDRNRELQHQIDKWQNLENKSEKEVVELRKRRIELEVRVKELEVSLKETRGFDKKIAKLEASLLETHEQVEQGHQEIIEAHAEAEQARKQAIKLEKKVAKLQAAADKARYADGREERGKSRDPPEISSIKRRPEVPSAIQEVSENSDDGVIDVPIKPPSQRQKPASTRSDKAKGKGTAIQHNQSEGILKQSNSATRHKESPKSPVGQDSGQDYELLENEEDVEVQEVPPPGRRDRDSDVAEVRPPAQKKPRSGSVQTRQGGEEDLVKKPSSKVGKSKASVADEQDETETHPKKRPRSKPRSMSGDPNGKKQPHSHVEPTTDAEGDDEQPQKKKKRKLNLTGGSGIFSGPASFTWSQDGVGDLGIPNELSPVKEGQAIPARSGTSSFLGGFRLWKT